ncbi:MAG: cytochrome c biogenesis protein CcsA, partial [Chloroflexi bacterium]|nr:cytochrome c biogenesis protein CcsA [Chloroflexota bacterium]
MLAIAVLLTGAVAILIHAFLTHDFSIKYVAEQSSLDMPWYYVLSSLYGGQAGSLFYWTWMLSLFSAGVVIVHWRDEAAGLGGNATVQPLLPYTMATLMGILTFFLGILCFLTNPFEPLGFAIADGRGLNPLLRDYGMLSHPPMLLAGYMSWSVPFAFAVAAMVTGRLGSEWIVAIRRWTLVGWTIQGMGLLLGGWWAYHVLGWGGYWGWDPVENVALLPWLLGTAFLHSIMVQERRGMLKVWNIVLCILAFALSIFGTFVVRSGVISSVHSFAQSTVGPYFFAFLAVVLFGSLGLLFYRLQQLKSEGEFDSMLSRESAFLFNNLLFAGVAFVTFWGTIFPLLSEA